MQFPALGRLEIQNELAAKQAQKDANTAQIAALQAANILIDEQIQLGQDTLDYIDAETANPDVTGFTASSPSAGFGRIEWDDMGAGVEYLAQKAYDPDFTEPIQMFSGAYVPNVQQPETTGVTVYYRIMSSAPGKDDSNWVTDSVVIT